MTQIVLKTDNQEIKLTQKTQNISLAQTIKTIKLSTTEVAIKLTQNIGQAIKLIQDKHEISFNQTNLRGLPGAPGEASDLSIGTVETGDTSDATITGEPPHQVLNLVLEKGEKGDQGDPGVDGDKNYTEVFAPTDNLVVTHNLNKYPAVDVINSAGDEVIGDVEYLTVNSLIVSFKAAFGGRVTCN